MNGKTRIVYKGNTYNVEQEPVGRYVVYVVYIMPEHQEVARYALLPVAIDEVKRAEKQLGYIVGE